MKLKERWHDDVLQEVLRKRKLPAVQRPVASSFTNRTKLKILTKIQNLTSSSPYHYWGGFPSKMCPLLRYSFFKWKFPQWHSDNDLNLDKNKGLCLWTPNQAACFGCQFILTFLVYFWWIWWDARLRFLSEEHFLKPTVCDQKRNKKTTYSHKSESR